MARAEQIARGILQRIRAAIAIRVWNPVNIARERSEASLIRMRLAGQGQGHHGAAVKSVFEGNDARPASVRPRNLHGVLHRLGTTVHEKRFLRELPWRGLVHALGQADVTLVGRDLDTRVQKTVKLGLDRIDDRLPAMAHIEAPDATGKVEIAV